MILKVCCANIKAMVVMMLLFLGLPSPVCAGSLLYNVRDYGAVGDGIHKDTSAVQAAIDAALQGGGGTVAFPSGRYLCGTVRLQSNVSINLTAGATIIMSPDNQDFSPYERLPYPVIHDEETTYFHYALFAGENVHDLAILGEGTIDGNRARRGGPKTVALKNCRNIVIRGITIRNSPNYTISLLGCDFVDITGVTIPNGYADGIDPDCSRYVRISDCFVQTDDDAICLKTSRALGERRATEHVTITNCVLSSQCKAVKLGTESSGDFRFITVSNCAVPRHPGAKVPTAGFDIEAYDGGSVNGVLVSNLTMEEVRFPVFIHVQKWPRDQNNPGPGRLENIIISNINAASAVAPVTVMGMKDSPVTNLSLSNVQVGMRGGGEPEAPAAAFWVQYAEGVTLSNIEAHWREPDRRPAFAFEEVTDLTLNGFRCANVAADVPIVVLNQVTSALITGGIAPVAPELFVRVIGGPSTGIRKGVFLGNASPALSNQPSKH